MNGERGTCAVILAAGRGRRLGRDDIPKVMLAFGNETLLDRHLNALRRQGVRDVYVVVGFESSLILRGVLPHISDMRISLIPVEWSGRGSLVSLHASDLARLDYDSLILMDGDVLCHESILEMLIRSKTGNALLLDRNDDDSDEPVKVCLCGQTIVDFDKRPTSWGDSFGESVGFFKLTRPTFGALGMRVEEMCSSAPITTEYEAALKQFIISPDHDFSVVDVTGIPWIEIDFPEDYLAAKEIYPETGVP